MAKNRPVQKPQKPVASVTAESQKSASPFIELPGWSAYVIVFLFSFLLYANTLQNNYALDDGIVLTRNRFTKEGIAGIKEHFTHDLFTGCLGETKEELVSGGRYRPIVPASLSVEYEIMRKLRHDPRETITDKNIILSEQDPYLSPKLSHGINALLFALTSLVLYYLMKQLVPQRGGSLLLSLPFIVTMLYAAHPIHTEAVANIKGRDEVLCMLLSLLSLVATIKYVQTQKIIHVLWGALVYFFALLSKENAITFLAVIPLTFFFFTRASLKNYAVTMGLFIAPVVVFLILRSTYTSGNLGLTQEATEILNNPFVLATPAQHYGTILLTFLYYFKLLIFPHPLTHDYFYNQIPYVDFSDLRVILSLIINAALIFYAIKGIKKKALPSFAILFYFITFSIASNVFFTIGALMNERFIYMCSLGFSILLAWLLLHAKNRFKLSNGIFFGAFILILGLYSAQTVARNFDWQDDYTICIKDAWKSPNSAKNNAALGDLLNSASNGNIQLYRKNGILKSTFCDLADGKMSNAEFANIEKLPDDTIRRILLDSAIAHIGTATRIHSTYNYAWILYADLLYKRNHNAAEVIPLYQNARGIYEANYKLASVYCDYGKPQIGKEYLLKAIAQKPDEVDCRFALSRIYAQLNQPDSVDCWLKRGAELRQPTAADYYAIGICYSEGQRNLAQSITYLKKASEMNPQMESYYVDLGAVYGMAGKFDESIATLQKLIQINPESIDANKYLYLSYHNKGDKQMEDMYLKKYTELLAKNKR